MLICFNWHLLKINFFWIIIELHLLRKAYANSNSTARMWYQFLVSWQVRHIRTSKLSYLPEGWEDWFLPWCHTCYVFSSLLQLLLEPPCVGSMHYWSKDFNKSCEFQSLSVPPFSICSPPILHLNFLLVHHWMNPGQRTLKIGQTPARVLKYLSKIH